MIDTGINLDEKVNTIKEQLETIDKLSMEEQQLKEFLGKDEIKEEKSGLSI